MANFSVRYSPLKLSLTVDTLCNKCGKKRKRKISRECYDNGLHDVNQTMRKHSDELDEEAEKMKRDGIMCKTCE